MLIGRYYNPWGKQNNQETTFGFRISDDRLPDCEVFYIAEDRVKDFGLRDPGHVEALGRPDMCALSRENFSSGIVRHRPTPSPTNLKKLPAAVPRFG